MNRVLQLLVLLVLLQGYKVHVFEAEPTTVTTADIAGAITLGRSCLNYCITGVCVWFRCSIYECSIETSIRVAHYNPNLVMSVYNEPSDNPWEEMESLFGSLDSGIVSGIVSIFHGAFVGGWHRTEGRNPAAGQSLHYKEATAIGHLFSSVSDFIGNTGYYYPSEAESFKPYLLSSLDALTWRLGLPEMLYLQNLLSDRCVVGGGMQ